MASPEPNTRTHSCVARRRKKCHKIIINPSERPFRPSGFPYIFFHVTKIETQNAILHGERMSLISGLDWNGMTVHELATN